MDRRAATLLCTICFQIFLNSYSGSEAWAGNSPSKLADASPPYPIQRCYPPHSACDTVGKNRPEIPLFADDEIIEVIVAPEKPATGLSPQEVWAKVKNLDPDKAKAELESNKPTLAQYRNTSGSLHWYGTNGKRHIYQQVGKRACVATCAGMLLLDHDKDVPYGFGSNTSRSNMAILVQQLKNYGLSANMQDIDYKQDRQETITLLQDTLAQHGSIALSIHCELCVHTIILDKINMDDETAIIRDPYHGWIIKINLSDLLNETRQIDKMVYIVSA